MGIVKRQSLPSTIATYIGTVLGAVNLILLLPNFLSPDQVGLTRLLIAVASITSQLSLFGVSYGVLRFFPYYNNKVEHHHGLPSILLRIAIAGSVLSAFIYFLLKPVVLPYFLQKSPLFGSYYFEVIPMAFAMALFEYFFYYARSLYRTVIPIFIQQVVLRVLQTIAILIYVMKWISFPGFIWLFISTYIIQLAVIIIYLLWLGQIFLLAKFNSANRPSIRQIIRYSLFIFAAAVAAIYTVNIDQVLLSSLIGLSAIAVYSISSFIGTFIQIPGKTMNQIAIPIISDAWKRNDLKKIQELYSQTALTQLLIGGILLLLIWINVDWLLKLLPAAYQSAKWIILVVGIGRLIDLATGINGEIVLYSKHVKVNLLTNVMLIVIATSANYFLIKQFGVIGSAYAYILSYVSYNGIRMIFLYREYKLWPLSFFTLRAILLLGLSVMLYLILPSTQYVLFNGIYKSIVVSSFFAAGLWFGNVSPEIKTFMQDAILLAQRRLKIYRH